MTSKRDKLDEYKDDILMLLSKKYSIMQIREFLINYKKVEVSKDCLYKYRQKIVFLQNPK